MFNCVLATVNVKAEAEPLIKTVLLLTILTLVDKLGNSPESQLDAVFQAPPEGSGQETVGRVG